MDKNHGKGEHEKRVTLEDILKQGAPTMPGPMIDTDEFDGGPRRALVFNRPWPGRPNQAILETHPGESITDGFAGIAMAEILRATVGVSGKQLEMPAPEMVAQAAFAVGAAMVEEKGRRYDAWINARREAAQKAEAAAKAAETKPE